MHVGRCVLAHRMSRAWKQKRPCSGGMLAISLLGCMPLIHAFQFKLECSTQVHAPGQACGSSTTELAGNQEIRRTQAQCDVRRRYIISNGTVCSACMSLHVHGRIQRLSNIVRFRTRGIASGAASTSQTDAIIAESVVPQLQEVLVWTGYVYARLVVLGTTCSHRDFLQFNGGGGSLSLRQLLQFFQFFESHCSTMTTTFSPLHIVDLVTHLEIPMLQSNHLKSTIQCCSARNSSPKRSSKILQKPPKPV